MEDLKTRISASIKGDVATDSETLSKMSRDTSIFTRTPSLVVYPKDAEDVSVIVKAIAENHGGTVAVKSVLAEGSTFTLELPLQ